MTINHPITAILLIALVAFVSGCGGSSGPQTYRVEGTVTYEGAPVEGADVAFEPTDSTGTSAGGRTDSRGKYTLMASFGGTGTTPGTYTVTITKRDVVATGRKVPVTDEGGQEVMIDEMVRKDMLPEQYGSSARTPLKGITVEAKKLNEFDFTLE